MNKTPRICEMANKYNPKLLEYREELENVNFLHEQRGKLYFMDEQPEEFCLLALR